MQRRVLLVLLSGLAVVAFAAFVLWPQVNRITPENFNRIEKRMSRAQVQSILGPRDYGWRVRRWWDWWFPD
jgi:hypothetical protein